MVVDTNAVKGGKAASLKGLNPQTPWKDLEFCGPVGAAGVVLGLPVVQLLLWGLCSAQGEAWCLPTAFHLPSLPAFSSLLPHLIPTPEVVAAALLWLALHVLLYVVLPGPRVKGVILRDGSQLTYPLNAFSAGVVSIAVWAALVYLGYLDPAFAYNNFARLQTFSVLFCFSLSVFLYAKSFVGSKTLLALGGNSGNVIYDFFIGRELNPRIGSIDLKYLCELRPGLVGWVVLNLSMAAKYYQIHGSLSVPLVLVNVFQAIYVFDALWFESAILTTMDITSDGFGFMLAFGDMSWVPFVYSLQSRYLVDFSDESYQLSPQFLLFTVLLKLFGYYVFRGSNSQKNEFRTNPNSPGVKNLKVLPTERGTKLIISGWWGVARHINYLGDLLMALSWCLPCGFNHAFPYFYFVYFAVLLIHRERRDDHACKIKYGKDWDKYCKIVPYRILPGVY